MKNILNRIEKPRQALKNGLQSNGLTHLFATSRIVTHFSSIFVAKLGQMNNKTQRDALKFLSFLPPSADSEFLIPDGLAVDWGTSICNSVTSYWGMLAVSLVFLDRIYWIDWIFLSFFPFPDEREKDNPPEAEGIQSSLIMFIMFVLGSDLSNQLTSL
ncbi:MAG: hypothetical protein U5R49_07575 [Deltaproteobacteria bacterium]|nr:hypothetical protein [Deltaproteobacteria bacterium]